MKIKKIDIEYIRTIFKYKDGKLFWIKTGEEAGWNTKQGYLRVEHKNLSYPVSRVIFFLHFDCDQSLYIDHINGVRNDNRIENLRLVSERDNAGNRPKNRNGKLVGCYFHKRDKVWHCQIKINGKSTYVSTHKTEIEAHEAYLKKKKEIEANNES